MHKNNKGFTLLELLIAMTILAIICSIGFPAYSRLSTRIHAKAAIMRLYRAIQLTRSEAIKNGVIATICPSSDHKHCGGAWQNGYLIFVDNRASGEVDPEDRLIKYFPASSGKGIITWKSFPKYDYLQMTPQGFTNNQDGTFCYHAANGYKISLIISKTGRMRMK